MRNKKGVFIGEMLLFLFYRIFILLLVGASLFAFVKLFVETQVDIHDVQADLFMHGLLHSKDGLSYYDASLDRVYPSMIHVSAFKNTAVLEEKLLQRMYYGDNTIIAAQLTLFEDGTEIGKATYGKVWYNRWIILAQTFLPGPGGTTEMVANKTVLLLDDTGMKTPGILQISVVMPNS